MKLLAIFQLMLIGISVNAQTGAVSVYPHTQLKELQKYSPKQSSKQLPKTVKEFLAELKKDLQEHWAYTKSHRLLPSRIVFSEVIEVPANQADGYDNYVTVVEGQYITEKRGYFKRPWVISAFEGNGCSIVVSKSDKLRAFDIDEQFIIYEINHSNMHGLSVRAKKLFKSPLSDYFTIKCPGLNLESTVRDLEDGLGNIIKIR